MDGAVPEPRQPRRAFALLIGAAVFLFLGGCGGGRDKAVSELQRLDQHMHQHMARYGSFPETIDPALPASPANLPYVPQRRVRVRLIGATPQSYGATARSGVWLCAVQVAPGEPANPDCTPTGNGSSEGAGEGRPPAPLDGILDEQQAPGDSA